MINKDLIIELLNHFKIINEKLILIKNHSIIKT